MRTLLALLLLCSPALAQTFDFELTGTPVVIDPTAEVTDYDLAMVCDTPGTQVGAFQMCFAWDDSQINVFGLQPLTISNPSFFAPYFTNGIDDTTFEGPYGPGVGYAACLYDFSLTTYLVPDTLTPILRIQVYSTPTSTPGPVVISFVSGLHLPGQFTTSLEVGFLDDTGQVTSYFPPDFPEVVTLVEHPLFTRGDPNGDGVLNLVDALCLLEVGFLGAPAPECEARLDVNANGVIDTIPDVMYLLGYLFQGGPPPPGGPACSPNDPLGLACPTSGCP